eukprot:CAMPEP_0206188772 /NCGR_PEP_ID=MMETSP0166-20121206/3770_1 /ASSEMBLY_ACC=CAM_ASM_000260 /TAXON_ID=95228 /ORGANISM="Vannella robusta, Strain DIVA3 518/3/11/1/6" /LENGTH=252 /DNA_ID=CAMNT_0053604557 /DNA_START=467 /DNA_END=1225 /DNA_ORIENTATION=+
MERWSNKVVLITGATAGIGKAITAKLVAQGVKVVGCGRRLDRLQELEAKHGDSFKGYQCDLAQGQSAISEMFQKIQTDVGAIHCLINNAGVGSFSLVLSEDSSFESWQKILNINVLAVAECSRLAFLNMKQNNVENGQLINISSLSGHRVPAGFTGNAMYSASKHALRALTEGIRQELREMKSSHRVCEISPGLVKTEFFAVMKSEKEAESFYQEKPHISADDVADSVIFVLSTPAHMEVNDILIRPTAQVV